MSVLNYLIVAMDVPSSSLKLAIGSNVEVNGHAL